MGSSSYYLKFFYLRLHNEQLYTLPFAQGPALEWIETVYNHFK
jgi:hypothetical protein